jgi:hypothetical protein
MDRKSRLDLEGFEQPAEPHQSAYAAGQAGDTQGLRPDPEADMTSVEELLEEGQTFEAAYVSGVEDAQNADEAEVTTRQVRVDDVPLEYLEED